MLKRNKFTIYIGVPADCKNPHSSSHAGAGETHVGAEETLTHDASGDAALLDLEVGSMSMDEFLLCFHGRPPPAPSLARGDPPRLPLIRETNANQVWKEVPSGGGLGCEGAAACGAVTLEDFLARNGAITAGDVVAPLEEQERAGVSVDLAISDRLRRQEQPALLDTAVLGFRNGVAAGGRRRARKRPALDNPVDKADLRRQKRMIKNRESAARSRERKQAYTVELESLVSRLEEENAILLNELEEQYEMRIHQLMENIIPVTEKRKPPHILRKINSMLW